MPKRIALLLTLCALHAFPQTERYDVVTFVPPAGWQRLDTLGTRAFFDSRIDEVEGGFCQIIFYPRIPGETSAEANFRKGWENLVNIPAGSGSTPVMKVEATPGGWTVLTGGSIIPHPEGNYHTILANISGYGQTMNIQVNFAGDQYAPVIEDFFNTMEVGENIPLNPQTSQSGDTKKNISMNSNTILDAYEFTAPDKWMVQNNSDHILIQNMESGCLIRILAPQPGSGDIEKEAWEVFNLMYAGWHPQTYASDPWVLSTGYLPLGLEFCMVEAPMAFTASDGSYTTEEGAAMVVKSADRVAIISVRHSGLPAHTECLNKYETWRRFFNSFTIKNSANADLAGINNASRLVGIWHKSESRGAADYIFAANGSYIFSGTIGSAYTTSGYNYDYLHTKTYNFEGDGTYSLSGNILTLNKKGSTSPEVAKIRFEKVNYGGKGWKERLYLLKEDTWGLNETWYEKQGEP